MADQNSLPFFGENIKLVSYCPVCENKHNATEAKMLDENEGARLVYIKCKKCHSSVVAVVFQNPFGTHSLGIVTDFTFRDALKWKDENQSISSDDVLEIHQFLNSHQNISKYI